jgi:hypothetical protein
VKRHLVSEGHHDGTSTAPISVNLAALAEMQKAQIDKRWPIIKASSARSACMRVSGFAAFLIFLVGLMISLSIGFHTDMLES